MSAGGNPRCSFAQEADVILSDADILAAYAANTVEIDPEPDWDTQLQPASIDLRLGYSFQIYKLSRPYDDRIIDVRHKRPQEYMSGVFLKEGERFILNPGEFALGTTLERIKLSPRLVGRVDGRSSWGRLGLAVHSTAGFIDPGFEGTITLEFSNVGRYPIAIYPGDRICQISLETTSRPAQRPYGVKRNSKYQGQVEATVSKLHEDLNEEEEIHPEDQ